MDKEHEIWNEEMAKRYDPDAFITKTSFLIRSVESMRLRKTLSAMAPNTEHRVLDVGCGPGNLTELLHGQEVIGVDISDVLLAKAKERTNKKPTHRIVKAPAETMPFPDNYFDRICCCEVMEHVKDASLVIKEIYRVAKHDAVVVITVPNESLINRTKKILLSLGLKKYVAGDYPMSDDMQEEWHVREVTDNWVPENFSDQNFKLIEQRGIPTNFLPYHRLYSFRIKKANLQN